MAALATYSDLQIAVGNWLNRVSSPTASNRFAPEFIELFEARVRREFRTLDMQVTAIFPVTAAYMDLPDDFLEIRALYLQDYPGRQLLPIDTQWARDRYSERDAFRPLYYSIQGRELRLTPKPDDLGSVQIDYYGFTPLGPDVPANWLLTKYPDLYLFGALVEAKAFAADADAAAWEARYRAGEQSLRAADGRAKMPPGSAVRIARWTP